MLPRIWGSFVKLGCGNSLYYKKKGGRNDHSAMIGITMKTIERIVEDVLKYVEKEI